MEMARTMMIAMKVKMITMMTSPTFSAKEV
jgi:hypothetical protein